MPLVRGLAHESGRHPVADRGVNNITINRAGSQLINGATSATISTDGGVLSLTFDGTNWLAW